MLTPELMIALLALVVLMCAIVAFFVFRGVILWYFRLNQIADSLAYIAKGMEEQEANS